MTVKELHDFCKFVQERFQHVHSNSFSSDILEEYNTITLDSQLAGEVIKKIVYFLNDESVDNLVYELQECHTALNSKELTETLFSIFKDRGHDFESDITESKTTSQKFKSIYQKYIRISPVKTGSWIANTPNIFTEYNAWSVYRHEKKIDERLIPDNRKKLNDEETLKEFYNCIINREYQKAFSCLSIKFQDDRFLGDWKYFENGFKNTLGISRFSYHELPGKTNVSSKWLIYYIETMNTYVDNNLFDFYRNTLDDIGILEKATDSLTKLKESLIKKNGAIDKINNIPLYFALSTCGIEDSRWIAGLDNNAFDEMYEKKEINIQRVLELTCVKEDGVWYINRLLPIIYSHSVLV